MDAWTGMRAEILASGTLPDRTALAAFTQQARELVEDELLPRWAEDWEAGRLGPSTADLSAARGLADGWIDHSAGRPVLGLPATNAVSGYKHQLSPLPAKMPTRTSE